MKWEPKKVYLYLVSLVTFIMVLIGSYNLVSTVVDMALPAEDHYPCPVEMKPGTPATEEEQKRCEEERERNARNQAIWRQRRLIQNSLFLIVTVPAYLYHWRAARKSEE